MPDPTDAGVIADPDDPRMAPFAQMRDRRLRGSAVGGEGVYIAEGETLVRRALKAGHRPRAVLSVPGGADTARAIVGGAAPVFVAAPEVMERLVGFDFHRGLMAAMERPPPRDAADVTRGARRVVMLEDLAEATNVGAAFRSVAALGADAVLVSNRCADPLYRRALRVSMGSVLRVPWARVRDWGAEVERLRGEGFTIVVLSPDDDAVDLAELSAAPPERLAMIVGAEAAGVRPRTRARADVVVRIPMDAGVSSLNVAAATAVAAWALRPSGPRGEVQ